MLIRTVVYYIFLKLTRIQKSSEYRLSVRQGSKGKETVEKLHSSMSISLRMLEVNIRSENLTEQRIARHCLLRGPTWARYF